MVSITIDPIHTSLCELYLPKDLDFHYFIRISQLSHFLTAHFKEIRNFHLNSNPMFAIVNLLHFQFLWDSAYSIFVSFAFGEMPPLQFCISITYSSTSFLKGFV